MTKKEKWIVDNDDELILFYGDENFNGSAYPCDDIVFMKMIADKLNKLEDENKQLKSEIENLKITIDARDTLIEVCEKKFRELGLIISVDDDGYVIE